MTTDDPFYKGPAKHRRYFDRAGAQISRKRWHELMADESYRIIAIGKVADCYVRTGWFGAESDGGNIGLLFYTAIDGVPDNDGDHDPVQEWHWGTEAEAREAHDEIMAKLSAEWLR